MLKILQARIHQYLNHELSDVQAGFRKKKNIRMRGQISSIHWIIEKPGEFQEKKKKYFCFIDKVKEFDCVNHSKLWNILRCE